MGCFALAILGSLANILIFPYARRLHSMTLPRLLVFYVVFLFVLYKVSCKIKRTEPGKLNQYAAWLTPAFSVTSLLLMLLCGYYLAHEPFCDNYSVFRGAAMIRYYGKISRDVNQSVYEYLAHFSNQWGFVLLLSLFPADLLGVSFESNTILYLLSGILALLFAMSFFVLLQTVKKRFGVQAQLMLLFCLVLFLPQYPAMAVLYTDTFSMPFAILALCCMLHIDQHSPRRKVIGLSVGIGVFLLIGSMIKMTCMILFAAAVLVWLLTLNPRRAAVCIMIPTLICAGGLKAVNTHMVRRVFEPNDVSRYETPLLHWIMMSIPTEDNLYGSCTDDYDYTWGLMEQGASHEEIMESIHTRMEERLGAFRSLKDIIYAVLCKNANYMGDGTFGMTEMLDDSPLRENILSSFVLYDRPYYALYADLCGGIWLAQLTMSVLICLKHIQKRCVSLSIPMIAFLGLMIFEMIWEARSRYIFNLTPLVLLIASGGMIRKNNEPL